DFPGGRRLYWHNLMAPEQNYGLIKFTPVTPAYTVLKQQDGSTAWAGTNITSVSASADVAYYHLDLGLATGLNTSDELMVVLDTYDDPVTSANRWGESQISNAISSKIGGTPLSTTQRSEFLIRLFHNGSNWRAQLYVTEAYDLYPLFGGNHDPLVQQLQSTVTDGAPWIPVKWKTNNADYATEPDTFYGTVGNSESLVGQLTVKESTESASSKDAVVLSGSNIDIHLPWSLLHFSDPSQRQVFHDDKTSTDTWNESVPSAGIANAVIFNGGLEGETERYSWNTWMDNPSVDSMTSLYTEQTKASYNLYKTAIQAINP
ncbi:MAG: hypothetical protein OEZ47_07680, partial [Gammaproteobacteria bacterium]|nr:hypothetical protein [Gammaproteobacteria bacterium]